MSQRAPIETTVHDHDGEVLRYTLKATGQSSERLGACEVCGQHVSEVYLQRGMKMFERPTSIAERRFGWTHHGMTDLFGHADCLVVRRKGVEVMKVPTNHDDANFRQEINGVDVLIGRDAEGFKAYIADRYEGLFTTLLRAYQFAATAANHPARRRPFTAGL
ncbi:MAG: hypothetical protein RXR20_26410 [Paraburkholderia sp.]